MFIKQPRHRIFDYDPRFYKPEVDEKERKKESWDFHRSGNKSRERETPFCG